MNKLLLTFLLSFVLLVAGCGGGGGEASLAGGSGSQTGGGADDPVDPDDPVVDPPLDDDLVLDMGNGTGGGFQSGVLQVPVVALSSGGDGTINLTIVDSADGSLYTGGQVTVFFSSLCINSGGVDIENPVITQTGVVSVTYDALPNGEATVLCQGDDVVTASATVGGQDISAVGTVSVAPPEIGTIEFVSSDPSQISLKGSGGTEQSTVTFRVLDSGTNPFPSGLQVNFEVDPVVGGIALQEAFDETDSQGFVEAIVIAGTAKATVKVRATVDLLQTITTTSDNLVITAGLPHQDGFEIAATRYNQGTYGDLNQQYNILVQLADRFGNAVPDTTEVSFTAEAGIVDTSCTTTNGECPVIWRTGGNVDGYPGGGVLPSPGDGDGRPGRVQILATVQGEESFTDRNGDGLFNDVSNPIDTFTNLAEPFRDDNSNGVYNSGEYFLDGGGNSTWDDDNDADNGQSELFNGLLCDRDVEGDCSTVTSVGISRLITLIQSYPEGSPNVVYIPDAVAENDADNPNAPESCVTGDNPWTSEITETSWAFENCPSLAGANLYIPPGGYFLTACVADANFNPFPSDATVKLTDMKNGDILGSGSTDYGNATEPVCLSFGIGRDTNPEAVGNGTLEIAGTKTNGSDYTWSIFFSVEDQTPP